MSVSRKKILRRLAKQEELEGKSRGIAVLRIFLANITVASQWEAFTYTGFHGPHTFVKHGFVDHTFYYPKKELISLFDAIECLGTNEEDGTKK